MNPDHNPQHCDSRPDGPRVRNQNRRLPVGGRIPRVQDRVHALLDYVRTETRPNAKDRQTAGEGRNTERAPDGVVYCSVRVRGGHNSTSAHDQVHTGKGLSDPLEDSIENGREQDKVRRTMGENRWQIRDILEVCKLLAEADTADLDGTRRSRTERVRLEGLEVTQNISRELTGSERTIKE